MAPEREHLSLWVLCLGELLSVDSEGYGEQGSGDGHHAVGIH